MLKVKAAAFGFWLCTSGGLALGAQVQPEREPSPKPAGTTDGSAGRAGASRPLAGQGMLLDWVPSEGSSPSWLPRFEEHVEVRPRALADAAARHLEGFDTLNGPPTSAPNVKELREAADHQLGQSADFLTLIVAGLAKLGQSLRGTPPPRYFLYLVKRGESQEALLREGRLPAEALYGPGLIYEPVAEFAKFDEALRAADRLRHRLASQEVALPDRP